MKRFAVLLLALVCLLSSGCHNPTGPESAPTPEPSCREAILGDWEFHSILIGRQLLDPGTLGIDSTLSFYANGAGVLKAQRGGDVQEGVFTYTVSGNEITMLDEDNEPMTAVYDPETDTLCMEEENMSIVLVRKTAEPDPTPEPTPEPDWTKATLERETTEDGVGMVAITVWIPAGATVTIDFPHQDDYTYTNADTRMNPRRVKIPVEVFLPNEPLDEALLTITPRITVTTADGVEHAVECPSFSYEAPMLLLAIDSTGEATGDGFYAKADASGVYHLMGMVLTDEEGTPAADAGVTLTVNGTEIPVYAGGVFLADLPIADGAPTRFVLRAEKNDHLTVTVTVIVEPTVSDA